MSADDSGYLFVTRGDVTTLCCDAWLVPSDVWQTVESPWRAALPRMLPALPDGWGDEGVRACRVAARTDADPAPWLVNVGAVHHQPVGWYLEGVRQFVELAASDLAGTRPIHSRARHLLALPLVGTGLGGATGIKGEVVTALVAALQAEAAARRIDIALVLWTGEAFAAAQAVRRTQVAPLNDEALAERTGLSATLVAESRRLAKVAEAGRLVLFLGAGVSAGAGLPLWGELLREMAVEGGLAESDLDAFENLDPLDRARVIEARLGGPDAKLGHRVAARFDTHRPSLAHTLLASLPINESATTNYDRLFEQACAGAKRPVAVLPYQSAEAKPRWLLKLHGCVSQPDDIVLTRDDYLRYGERRAALMGIVQALLVTRHILFVGFSLNDDNFHRLVHDVRKALGKRATGTADLSEFGTALLLGSEAFLKELWQGDVRTLPMRDRLSDARQRAEAARSLDIFLDLVAMFATSAAAHLLDPTFDAVLTDDERWVRDALAQLARQVPAPTKASAAWGRVEAFLRSVGHRS